ncbi:MAG: leucine--tRNA ligase, partial [candidate division WOR-3 bacterium]
WEEKKVFKTKREGKKYYCLVMFPYPSGDLHMGHVKNYVIGDVIARYKRQMGYNVLHPFGWDAFGLPAENAAILHGIHPWEWTKENIDISRKHLKMMGIGYDWEREIMTCDERYYKWNQYFFIKFYENGLAYRKKAYVNWCPGCQTVLANEQVVDGRCYRKTCQSIIEKKELEQWFFKITAYAERLLQDLDKLDWPENVKIMQRNWIGKSEGVEVDFPIEGGGYLRIFTTRPDTLFGVTFMAIAPEAEILEEVIKGTGKEEEVYQFKKEVLRISEIERTAIGREKRGVFINKYAINPLTNEKIPIFVADYVLATYGTGAIMAVPAHDQRDFEFAKKYGLPIKVVINPYGEELKPENMEKAFEEEGVMVNSGIFTGLSSKDGIERITKFLEEKGIGRRKINYRLKDWLISRQRYWGTPIPMIHCDNCGIIPEKEENLPVVLPKDVKDYLPKGKSVLAGIEEFINTTCPKCGQKAKRDPDTMDTFVDSSWYFLRYLDPHNNEKPFTYEDTKYWLPIDKYIGGIEHATGHLIYFRFFTKVLYDLGFCAYDEPCASLFTQGMVLYKGKVMSSSQRHGVWVGDFLKEYSADIARLTILFAAPPEKDMEWSEEIVSGVKRFLERVWRLYEINGFKVLDKKPQIKNEKDKYLYIRLNQTIKKVIEDMESFQFNTAIASLMEFLNDLYKFEEKSEVYCYSLYIFYQLLSPFASHIAEEINERCGFKNLLVESRFPNYDKEAIYFEKIEIPIQINGKIRAKIEVLRNEKEERIKELALENERIKELLKGKEIVRIIYVPNKLINIVVKE